MRCISTHKAGVTIKHCKCVSRHKTGVTINTTNVMRLSGIPLRPHLSSKEQIKEINGKLGNEEL